MHRKNHHHFIDCMTPQEALETFKTSYQRIICLSKFLDPGPLIIYKSHDAVPQLRPAFESSSKPDCARIGANYQYVAQVSAAESNPPEEEPKH